MEIVLAAIVVLEDLEGVPVTVRQSPTATALWGWVAVSENVVVPVQFTVVCPVLAFWTSMEVPLMDATLPLANPPAPWGDDAAPALEANPMRTLMPSKAAPVGPYHLRHPRGLSFSAFMVDAAFPVVSSGTSSCVARSI
jgi:hypothetical protein